MMIKTKQVYILKNYNEEEAKAIFNSDEYTENGSWELVYMKETLTGYVGLMVQTDQGKCEELIQEIKNDPSVLQQGYLKVLKINSSETDQKKLKEIAKKLTPEHFKLLGIELKNYTNIDPETGKNCFDYLALYEAI